MEWWVKFCYVDESGTGSEPFAVMVGVIVDAQRMHITKYDWQDLLRQMSEVLDRDIKEFHARDFYRGNGPWRDIDGETRSEIIESILSWLINRKHSITFVGVDKELFNRNKTRDRNLLSFHSFWCFMGMHLILTVQKHYQKDPKNKGNTVFIFDEEVREKLDFVRLLKNPPSFVDEYYSREEGQERLDQIIDVPYYGDSKDVNLLQIADLVAYVLRLHVELEEGRRSPEYVGENENIQAWIEQIISISLPASTRYLAKGKDHCSELFCKYAPETLMSLGR
jgi:hypothetical protein